MNIKAGDRIRVRFVPYPNCEEFEEYTVEEFRGCLGIFETGSCRKAQEFSPLCSLYRKSRDAVQGYIPNYGEYWDKWEPAFEKIEEDQQ